MVMVARHRTKSASLQLAKVMPVPSNHVFVVSSSTDWASMTQLFPLYSLLQTACVLCPEVKAPTKLAFSNPNLLSNLSYWPLV
jgi:hypothetical protein